MNAEAACQRAPTVREGEAAQHTLWARSEPWKVLARSNEPIMEPLAEYEQAGFFGNVVFTNGHVVDGDTVTVYYGASDSVIAAAKLSIREILQSLGR